MSKLHPDQSEILVPTNAEEGERIVAELKTLESLREKLEVSQENIIHNLTLVRTHFELAISDDKTNDSELQKMKIVIQKYGADLQSIADQLLAANATTRFYKAQYLAWERIHVSKT